VTQSVRLIADELFLGSNVGCIDGCANFIRNAIKNEISSGTLGGQLIHAAECVF